MELSEIVIADQNRELYNKYSESVRACVCVKAMNFFLLLSIDHLTSKCKKDKKEKKILLIAIKICDCDF